MKNLVLFFFLSFVLGFATVGAQILNAGFEDWDANGNPVNWKASNSPPLYSNILKTSDRHSGSWALEGDVVPFSSFAVGPSVYSGGNAEGFAINFRPRAIKGYYKFTSVQGDFLQVQANFRKNGTYIGVGADNLSPVSTYTQFSIDINFLYPDVPDTATIAIFVSNLSGFPHVGSKIFIDDLSWGTATDVSDYIIQAPSDFELKQNYPNPFNPSTIISYSIPIEEFVSLKVFNSLGEQVADLVNETKPAGNYSVLFNSSELSSGVYIYNISAGTFFEEKKMILLR